MRELHVHDDRKDNRKVGKRAIDVSVQIVGWVCGSDGSTQQWHDLNDVIRAWQTAA